MRNAALLALLALPCAACVETLSESARRPPPRTRWVMVDTVGDHACKRACALQAAEGEAFECVGAAHDPPASSDPNAIAPRLCKVWRP